MFRSVDMDDFSGSCLGQKYPLINAAKEELKGYVVENLQESSSSAAVSGKSSGKYIN